GPNGENRRYLPQISLGRRRRGALYFAPISTDHSLRHAVAAAPLPERAGLFREEHSMLDSIVFRICGIFAGIVIATSSASADETRNPLRDPPRDENVLRPSEDAQQPAASNAPLRLSFPSSPPVQAIATDVPDDELQLTG